MKNLKMKNLLYFSIFSFVFIVFFVFFMGIINNRENTVTNKKIDSDALVVYTKEKDTIENSTKPYGKNDVGKLSAMKEKQQNKKEYVTNPQGKNDDINSAYVGTYHDAIVALDGTYSGFVINADNADDLWMYEIEKQYGRIPINVREHFEKNGGTILCTVRDIGEMFFEDEISAKACIHYPTLEIWISARDSCTASVMHEMGHYVDYCNDFVSRGDEFKAIFDEEFDDFERIDYIPNSLIETPGEYFAQCYRMSLEKPELMQANCPKTYDFVMYYSSLL